MTSRFIGCKFILITLLLSFVIIGPCVVAQTRGLDVVAAPINQESLPIGKQIAAFIAIDRYSGWMPLKKPVSDARALKTILERRYYIDEVRELYNEEATRVGILRFMERLIADTKPEDSIFIYYAGHGHLDTLTDMGAWIPQDAGTDTYEQRNWLSNAQVRALIGKMRSRHVVLVSDSCFSGDILNVNRASLPAITNDYFRKAFSRRSRQVLSSGASEAVPDDSPFSAALRRTLEENTAPYVDPFMLFSQIRLSVKDTTPLLGDLKDTEAQEGGSFIFFLKPSVQAGRIKVDAPTDVRVTISSSSLVMELQGGTISNEIPSGTYDTIARGPGYQELRSSVEVLPATIVTFQPFVTGRITVYSEPSDAIIYVDSPIIMELVSGRGVDLTPATYALRVEREGYREQSRMITLMPGIEERLEVTLEPSRPGRLELPASAVQLKLTRGGEEIDPLKVPTGIKLDLEVSSPQAVSLDIKPISLKLKEGENQTLEIPSGRFVLPQLPEGSQVLVGGLALSNTASSIEPGKFISPELPAGIYELTVQGPLSWKGKVTTKPKATVEPSGYRETAITSFLATRSSLEARVTAIPKRRATGWMSFIGGLAGSAGAAASYFLGQQAMEAYKNAVYPEDIDAAKAQVQLYSTILPAAAAVGGLGLLMAPIFWSGNNEAALKESIRKLDESIQRLKSF